MHEVSGLSPYESDGRERLGLGLKADQILEADGALYRDRSGLSAGSVRAISEACRESPNPLLH